MIVFNTTDDHVSDNNTVHAIYDEKHNNTIIKKISLESVPSGVLLLSPINLINMDNFQAFVLITNKERIFFHKQFISLDVTLRNLAKVENRVF